MQIPKHSSRIAATLPACEQEEIKRRKPLKIGLKECNSTQKRCVLEMQNLCLRKDRIHIIECFQHLTNRTHISVVWHQVQCGETN